MERTNFEKLDVYRLSEKLADDVWNIVVAWDRFAKDTVGKQIVRAADGIGANISEGSGRGSLQDNRRFVRMARGSLYETIHWLRRSYMRKLLTQAQVKKIAIGCRRTSPEAECFLTFCRQTRQVGIANKAQSTKYHEVTS